MTSFLRAKCVFCKHVETFTPAPTDLPMCPKCFSPMVTEVVGRDVTHVEHVGPKA